VNILITYPPRAYFFMPYLAPYLLKGHLVAGGHHRVRTEDLNLEYARRLWSEDFAAAAARRLADRGERRSGLLADMVAHQGAAAYAALRDGTTFQDHDLVRFHATVLKQASAVERALDAAAYREGLLPKRLRGWRNLLHAWRGSAVEAFIDRTVAGGRYDDAELVGISAAYLPQVLPAMVLAERLKARQPGRAVVVGGGAITHLLRELRTDEEIWDLVDFAVPYEGEHTFLELADSIERGAPPPVNVVYRQGGRIVYQQDLAGRPKIHANPDFEDLTDDYPTPATIYPLLTSKGCYWGRCGFCTHHEGYGQGYHRIDDEVFDRSLTSLLDQGARHFYFVDEAIPPRKLRSFVERFAALRIQDVPVDVAWMAEARLEKSLVSRAAVEDLARSGCRLLVNGVESGVQRVLDLMRKGIDIQLVAEHARLCAEVGGVRVGWMFFIGFPGESAAEAAETVAFIRRHGDVVDFAGIGTFGLERDSPIWCSPTEFSVSRIHDADRPYRLDFDFDLEDGTTVCSGDLPDRLRTLVAAHPGVGPVLERAIDRALVMFFPPKPPASASATPTRRIGYRPAAWRSDVAGGLVRVDPSTRRLVVTHGD